MRFRRIVEMSLGVGLGGGLLYWVLRDYPWRVLRGVSWEWSWFAGAAIGMTLAHGIRAWRWKLFLKASHHDSGSTREAFMALMAGYLVNLALPRVGEVVRCSLLYRAWRVPLEVSLGTVIGERVLDVLLLGVWGAVVAVVEGPEWLQRLGMWQWAPLLIGGGVVGIGFLWGVYRYRQRLRWTWVQRLVTGMTSAFTVRPPSLNLLLSLSIWLCYWIATWMAGLALGETFSPWAAWVLLVGSGLAMALPVPGGIGTFHAIGFILLSYLGYTEIQSKTIVLLIHAFQTLHTILLGIIGIGYFSKRCVLNISSAS